MDSDFASFVKGLEDELVSPVLHTGHTPPEGGSIVSIPTVSNLPSAGSVSNLKYETAPPWCEQVSHPAKLLLISTHIQQASGYSKVSYGMIRELAKLPWLSLVHFGIQSNKSLSLSRSYPPNVKVYDAVALEDKKTNGFGYNEIASVVEKEKPDIVMLYNDIIICTQYLTRIMPLKIKKNMSFQVWTYLDQVYECQPSELLDSLQRDTDRFFAFTKEWKEILRSQGVSRPIDIINHGFDRNIFPAEMNRADIRKGMGIPEEVFLFLNVNRNQPRKRHDLMIMAFVDLIVRHPKKLLFLMCVCDKGDKGGFPLFEIFRRELVLKGVNPELFANRLLVSSREMSISDEEIGQFYTIADVGISTADGEGFGLCAFEQMGLGIPQVLTNLVGHREYCKPDNSILVSTALRTYMPTCISGQGGDPRLVDPHQFSLAMERYVLEDDLRMLHGFNAKKTVTAYTWPKVMSTLIKRLDLFRQELSISTDD
jgi:glycosyltransferase involved in cell wall biosynthesis